jgi:hypothetical protein
VKNHGWKILKGERWVEDRWKLMGGSLNMGGIW